MPFLEALVEPVRTALFTLCCFPATLCGSDLTTVFTVWRKYAVKSCATMIYVTHDQVEAMTLADRIVVLEFGKIAQVGTPKELYENPANLFVAQFIGSPKMNILPCDTGGGAFHLSGGGRGAFEGPTPAAKLGIRPEHIAFTQSGQGHCSGTVDVVEYHGANSFVIVDCGDLGQIMVRTGGDSPVRRGESVGLGFDPRKLSFFDADGLRAPS